MEVRDMILRHGKMLTEYKGEMTAMREMRSHMAWYTKGMRNSAALRCEINQVETLKVWQSFWKSGAGKRKIKPGTVKIALFR